MVGDSRQVQDLEVSVDPDGRLKGELPLKLNTGKESNQGLLQALGLLGPVPEDQVRHPQAAGV